MATIEADQAISARTAALTAGFGLLVMAIAAPFGELYAFPPLITPGDVAATVQAISASPGLYLAGMFGTLVTYIADVIVAWALYVLLAPVNRLLSLLTAWFRLIYTAIAFVSLLKLVTVFRLIHGDYGETIGADQLHAQVQYLLSAWRYEWGFALIVFGVYLGFLGYLVYRAEFIPKVFGVVVVVAGAGYVIFNVGQFVAPDVDLGWLVVTFLGELVFMLWLLFRGWTLR